ncbi:MAG: DNA topoisomerase IV subunit A [Thermoplasmata archaeon]|nr:DNA topoisomerase IV subunit A [Thermoplasmata archaeon]MCI4359013.1 DNA topoisomerase IV subunit A [Thermoplasmata archaeon]
MPPKRAPASKTRNRPPEHAPTEALAPTRKLASEIYEQLSEGEIPRMRLPLRTKQNIQFQMREGVWRLGRALGTRSARKLDGALMLLRTFYLVDFINEMARESKTSTLRELYYISEGWEESKFHSEDESNLLIEDLEVLCGRLREDFRLHPEENGASVIGDLTIRETNRKGVVKKINCRDDVGDGGYALPFNVEREKIEFVSTNARFVIAIECGGMVDRLAENGFDEKHDAVLLHLKGQPARSTRRFLKRMSEELKLPVVVFTDGDPWSFRIFASVAYGAIKTAHISQYLATPQAEFLGVTASDIENYKLPSDALSEQDVRALQAELTDPRFATPEWRSEIELMLKNGKKAEQQSLAKYGLNYVTDTYLPEKLTELGVLR